MLTQAQKDEFLGHMRAGMRRGAAANAMGLERKAVLDFIQEDQEFESYVLDAEGEANEHVEEALFQAAISGSVPAAKIWLSLRRAPASTELAIPDATGDELSDLMRLSGAGTGSDA